MTCAKYCTYTALPLGRQRLPVIPSEIKKICNETRALGQHFSVQACLIKTIPKRTICIHFPGLEPIIIDLVGGDSNTLMTQRPMCSNTVSQRSEILGAPVIGKEGH